MRPALSLALAGLLCRTAQGKLTTGAVRIGGQQEADQWRYLSKFGYTIGAGSYEVRVRSTLGTALGDEPRVDLQLFLDEEWDEVESLPPCERAARSRTTKRPRPSARPGEWGAWTKGQVVQQVRSHIWYFALSGCAEERAQDLEFEIRMRQFDRSELGAEMRCMPIISTFVLGAMTVFAAGLGRSCAAARASGGGVHSVIRALVAAVALQWAALLCEVLHLWSYRSNGFGAPVADALSGMLDMLSQVVIATVLVAIAHGYCLTCARARELPGLLPMSAVVAAAHVALVLLDKLWGEASHEHHETGGALGVAMVAMRLALFAWFAAGLRALVGRVGPQLQCFVRLFGAAGAAYLLSHPVLLLLVQVAAPYLRHPLLQIGLLGAQAASSLGLAALLLSGSGCFYSFFYFGFKRGKLSWGVYEIKSRREAPH